jgi:hypothetical protein
LLVERLDWSKTLPAQFLLKAGEDIRCGLGGVVCGLSPLGIEWGDEFQVQRELGGSRAVTPIDGSL